jgi:hypothetical protein
MKTVLCLYEHLLYPVEVSVCACASDAERSSSRRSIDKRNVYELIPIYDCEIPEGKNANIHLIHTIYLSYFYYLYNLSRTGFAAVRQTSTSMCVEKKFSGRAHALHAHKPLPTQQYHIIRYIAFSVESIHARGQFSNRHLTCSTHVVVILFYIVLFSLFSCAVTTDV